MSPILRTAVSLIALCVAPGVVMAQEATPPPVVLNHDQAVEDVQLAIDAFEAALPNIYWHQTPQNWAQAKAAALARIGQANDPVRIYSILTVLSGQIGEGHLTVSLPKGMPAQLRVQTSGLPLDLHWSTDGVFVAKGYGEAESLPVGSRLLSINGEGYDVLLAELMSMTSHDGHIATGAMRDGKDGRYAMWRSRLRGPETRFALRYLTPDGQTLERTVAALPFADRPAVPAVEPDGLATLEWIAPGVAYLNVPSFSNSRYRAAGRNFRAEMQRLFEDIRRGQATRLILDLRENGGGSEPNESILFSFLVDTPLHKYADVEARGKDLRVVSRSGAVFTHEVYDEDEINFQQATPDGRLHRLNVAPQGLMSHWEPSSPVFKGRVVVLAGGYTFSGGAELASMLYHVWRGVFVGEEVGGTHEGNTSGYKWDIDLPNSGVQVHVPVLQYRFDWPGLPAHRGVQPDCNVPPLVTEIGEERDRAWRVARTVVMQDWTTPDQARCPAL